MQQTVVIPAYNEAKTIGSVLTEIQKVAQHIIVVDDGSSDATAAISQQAGVLVVQHKLNLGKGAALKTGCDLAVSRGAQRLVVLDADGQHNAQLIPDFLSSLDQGYDIIFGCRTVPKSMPLVMRFGNKLISDLFGMLYQIKVPDTQCGYRAFTAAAYKQLRWEAQDYFVETEMLINTGRKKLKHCTLPIETIYAEKYKGTTVLDGVLIVVKLLGGKLW